MVAIDFEKCIPLHKFPFSLKSLLVVLHDGEDVELPKLLTVSKIDVVGTLFIVVFQCFEVVVFRMTEFIPAFPVAFVHIAENDEAVVPHVKFIECAFFRFGILGDVLVYFCQSPEYKLPFRGRGNLLGKPDCWLSQNKYDGGFKDLKESLEHGFKNNEKIHWRVVIVVVVVIVVIVVGLSSCRVGIVVVVVCFSLSGCPLRVV